MNVSHTRLSKVTRACIHTYIHACMYVVVCMHVCMYACMHVCMYACMYAWMYLTDVCTCVHMYVRVHVCVVYVYVNRCIFIPHSSTLLNGGPATGPSASPLASGACASQKGSKLLSIPMNTSPS